jgi:hypothetical protein
MADQVLVDRLDERHDCCVVSVVDWDRQGVYEPGHQMLRSGVYSNCAEGRPARMVPGQIGHHRRLEGGYLVCDATPCSVGPVLSLQSQYVIV